MNFYKLTRRERFGTTVTAEKDLLPGSEVFCESKPLLWIPKSTISQYESFDALAPFYAAYDHFLDLMGSAEQTHFLKLCGPVTGDQPDQIRRCFRNACVESPEGCAAQRDAMDLFVKIASIMRINSFEIDGGRCIFAVACRISHSCRPNCVIELSDSRCICRCILPVTEGEELTIEYNLQHRFIPICERRRIHAQTKDFTCHCQRCDAEGDDTRQFPCFDTDCPGQHSCRAPLDHRPLAFADQKYLGVEYEAPHLLACKVCHRLPSWDYQFEQLLKEETLGTLTRTLQEEYCLLDERDVAGTKQLLVHIAALSYPALHSAAIPLNDFVLEVHWDLFKLCGDSVGLAEAGVRALAPFEHMALFPNDTTCSHLLAAGLACATAADEDTERLAQAVEYLRRALRMYMVLAGRERALSQYHARLADALLKLQALQEGGGGHNGQHAAHCAFCEESPTAAAMTLSLCGQCQLVPYCSVPCQQAHWKVHKAHCAAPKNVISP
jgi:hypothetical protein